MSTSSGREGFCERCGHAKNEHALKADSRCKKCKKYFEICQQTHSGASGRRLCYIPCNCGKNNYPDKAKAAVPLEPHEYLVDHPAYRPLGEEESTWDTSLESSPPQATLSLSQGASTHHRNISQESEDPLQWSDTKYEQNTNLPELIKAFAMTSIGSAASAETTTPAKSDASQKHQQSHQSRSRLSHRSHRSHRRLQTGTSGNGMMNTNANTDHARTRMVGGNMNIDKEESKIFGRLARVIC